jgi:hypothetical protein
MWDLTRELVCPGRLRTTLHASITVVDIGVMQNGKNSHKCID